MCFPVFTCLVYSYEQGRYKFLSLLVSFICNEQGQLKGGGLELVILRTAIRTVLILCGQYLSQLFLKTKDSVAAQ